MATPRRRPAPARVPISLRDHRYSGFPAGFFDRADETDDALFYGPPRLVTHIDTGAIAAVGTLYRSLPVRGRVLDLMSSWISHFDERPDGLIVQGMNSTELAANRSAHGGVVCDLNATPELPFVDGAFDASVCCVSVDYLVRPVEVFAEVARVVRSGGPFVCTFSNRCFPTKAVKGWLANDDEGHGQIVATYFRRAGGWTEPTIESRRALDEPGDPLWAVWARTT